MTPAEDDQHNTTQQWIRERLYFCNPYCTYITPSYARNSETPCIMHPHRTCDKTIYRKLGTMQK